MTPISILPLSKSFVWNIFLYIFFRTNDVMKNDMEDISIDTLRVRMISLA